MAHVQWCIGNTTLREAARLKGGLRILEEYFDGKSWSYKNQEKFLELLQQENIYKAGEAKSSKQVEQHGRIWSSAFNELGFATCYKKGNKYVPGGVSITKAGKALLSGNYVEEDVWLRQLLKVQFPNPLPQKSESQYPQFHLLPFQATLRVIKACDGISKDEGFILNTLRTMTEVDKAVKFIKKYRKGLSRIRKEGRDAISRYITQQQCDMARLLYKHEIEERSEYLRVYYGSRRRAEDKELLSMIVKGGKGANTVAAIRLANKLVDLKKHNASLRELEKRFLSYYLILKSSSWKDYIDVTARYFRTSGLLTIHRSRINIAEPHGDIVEWILSCKWQLKKKGDYLQYLHNHNIAGASSR